MPYISSDGTVGGGRNLLSVNGMISIFWGVITFFKLFFMSLVQPATDAKGGSTSSGGGGTDWRGGGGGPGGPRRRMGGINHGRGAAAPPMAGRGG